MYELKKKIRKLFTSKCVGTGPSSYEYKKIIYRAAVSRRLTNTVLNTSPKHGKYMEFLPFRWSGVSPAPRIRSFK